MKGQKNTVHGWVVLDKPLGLTSTQALGKVRKLLGGKKVGHGGTLDPLASGVLPLAFGEATKTIPYIMDTIKEYEFTICFGEQKNTDDAEGETIKTSDFIPNKNDILKVIPSFVGEINQIPPMFSAIKLGGKRAYDLARAGGEPEMKSRLVVIHKLELVEFIDKNHASFKVVCGKGTYVRSLARDIAKSVKSCGYVSSLRRTKVGSFEIKNAFSLEKLEELSHKGSAHRALLAIDSALDDIPGLNLTADEAQRLRAGLRFLVKPDQISLIEEKIILASYKGLPVALVKVKEGSFCVVRGFNF